MNTYDLSYIPILSSYFYRGATTKSFPAICIKSYFTNFRSKVYQLSIKSVSTFHQKCIIDIPTFQQKSIRASNKPNHQQDLSLETKLFLHCIYYNYNIPLFIIIIIIIILRSSSQNNIIMQIKILLAASVAVSRIGASNLMRYFQG